MPFLQKWLLIWPLLALNPDQAALESCSQAAREMVFNYRRYVPEIVFVLDGELRELEQRLLSLKDTTQIVEAYGNNPESDALNRVLIHNSITTCENLSLRFEERVHTMWLICGAAVLGCLLLLLKKFSRRKKRLPVDIK